MGNSKPLWGEGVKVIITLRADFYDRPLQYRDFGEVVRKRMETILPMSPDELEAGYFAAYKAFYSWSSILRRCRPREPGFAKRLFLNVAYKRVEPLYGLLGRPLPIGWLRGLFHWYARPSFKSPQRRPLGSVKNSTRFEVSTPHQGAWKL